MSTSTFTQLLSSDLFNALSTGQVLSGSGQNRVVVVVVIIIIDYLCCHISSDFMGHKITNKSLNHLLFKAHNTFCRNSTEIK